MNDQKESNKKIGYIYSLRSKMWIILAFLDS